MCAVCADYYPCALFDSGAAFGPTADAGHSAVLSQQRFDNETLAQFGTGLNGSAHENIVKHEPARSVAFAVALYRYRRSLKNHRARIESKLIDCGAVCSNYTVENSPA